MAKSSRTPGPMAVAKWRYQQIEALLDENLHALGIAQLVEAKSRQEVVWPSGAIKAASRATIYRWLTCCKQGGLEALAPKVRTDRGIVRTPIGDAVIDEGIRLLLEDPSQPLTFLQTTLEATVCEPGSLRRSTLQRRLCSHPSYEKITTARQTERKRTRFCAKAPHDTWQTDAKGPVTVTLTSGQTCTFHVLTILDDATRAVLAAIIASRANLKAAITVFILAALRWGLPTRLYADKASIFDSHAFRSGLAQMGSFRIPTKPRNAEARGKIERYHQDLVLWFTKRLPHQQVVDLAHLQRLLDGIIEGIYQPHYHRSLRQSPQAALSGVVSIRTLPPSQLVQAFLQRTRLKAHRKTGEVVIGDHTYLVPDHLRGQRLWFDVDLTGRIPPQVIDPNTDKPLSLSQATIAPLTTPPEAKEPNDPRGAGPLQAIYDQVRGKPRALGEPGFGLPEIYQLLGSLCGRDVPRTEAEATLVQRGYNKMGPLPKAATLAAMTQIGAELGTGRPIQTYLDALQRRVQAEKAKPNPDTR